MADPTAPPTGDPNAAAYPPQQGYPPQTYPPQQPPAAGYPPQQPGYPPQQQQPGYPPQQPAAYPPPQAGYPPQPDAGAPPSYYQPQPGAYPPQQPQQVATDTTNVVVVQQQPTATVQTTTVYTRRYGNNDHGLLFAIIASCIVFWCGGWCGLICTIAACYFALQAQQHEHAGNVEATAQNHKWSYILSIVGLVVGFGFLFIYIISGAARQ